MIWKALAIGMPFALAAIIGCQNQFFLTAQDLETTVPPLLLRSLLTEIETLYLPDRPWPLPLRQAGRLFATETHLDLEFATIEIDVELRLAGLDIDPGWVPWLGRVVAFHYDAIQTHHRRH